MDHYSIGFRERMVERLAGPDAVSASALSREVGVPQATLSRCLLAAPTLLVMHPNTPRRQEAQSPRQWSGVEKLQIVLESAGIAEAELGEFLRRKGIHAADLKAWRDAASEALDGSHKAAKASAAAACRIKELERELAKKEKRLRAVNALLELQKKSARSGGTRTSPHRRGARHDSADAGGSAGEWRHAE